MSRVRPQETALTNEKREKEKRGAGQGPKISREKGNDKAERSRKRKKSTPFHPNRQKLKETDLKWSIICRKRLKKDLFPGF